jgi:shikimate dehydrogenase
LKRLAVLGQPVSHSLSPAIHAAAFRALGIGGEWSYEAIEVAPGDFAARVRAMPGEGFVGANVTVPHKLAALEVADDPSVTAREIGAANTLSFRAGRIQADNTDAVGLLSSLPQSAAGSRALVLGAGGAGRAAVWALRDAGAEVAIWNRTAERAQALASEFEVAVADADSTTGLLPCREFELLINTTTVGLHPSSSPGADLKALSMDADCFAERQIVVDLVYGPEETEFLLSARERGALAIDGREVLIHQGAASFRIWTGLEPPIDAMREATK